VRQETAEHIEFLCRHSRLSGIFQIYLEQEKEIPDWPE